MAIGYGNSNQVLKFIVRLGILNTALHLALSAYIPLVYTASSFVFYTLILIIMYWKSRDGKVEISLEEKRLILNYKYDRIEIKYDDIAELKEDGDVLVIGVKFLGEQRIQMKNDERDLIFSKLLDKLYIA